MPSNFADLMDHQAVTQLETLIDRFTLPAVVDCLGDICQQKAEHLAANWQDQEAAANWQRNAGRFRRLWTRMVRQGNPRSLRETEID